mmetsp:Transcript_4392/g.17995  ORF Transcript_4392/g.17995 Transcript_4392/m.17995 type:complete len:249 (-) Transcript_4392:7489-8235(-)
MSCHHCALLVRRNPTCVAESSPVFGSWYTIQPLKPLPVLGKANGESGAVFATPASSSESSRMSPTRSNSPYVFFASSTATSAMSRRTCSQSHAHIRLEKSSNAALFSGAFEPQPARLGVKYTIDTYSLTRSKISNRSSCSACPGPSLQYSLSTLKYCAGEANVSRTRSSSRTCRAKKPSTRSTALDVSLAPRTCGPCARSLFSGSERSASADAPPSACFVAHTSAEDTMEAKVPLASPLGHRCKNAAR